MTNNVWAHKPWWCQPWSILLTGTSWTGGLYLWLGLSWLSVVLAAPVLVWMVFFVGIYPTLVRRADRRTGPG
ncbi:DUF6737 family protein [Candidatus Cyanaurora vandensis]|uniref:DUF6737 family protein n=1 Tax=Candidatus Cyanaurora vandensis TaxID=2714958 RepID=UPI00257B62A4|nr:DUF6737 family protein [Candidatus Cyanaurora vandensis]